MSDNGLTLRAYKMLLALRTEGNQEYDLEGDTPNRLIGALLYDLKQNGRTDLPEVSEVVPLEAFLEAERQWNEGLARGAVMPISSEEWQRSKRLDESVETEQEYSDRLTKEAMGLLKEDEAPYLGDLGITKAQVIRGTLAISSRDLDPKTWDSIRKPNFFSFLRCYEYDYHGKGHSSGIILDVKSRDHIDLDGPYAETLYELLKRAHAVKVDLVVILIQP